MSATLEETIEFMDRMRRSLGEVDWKTETVMAFQMVLNRIKNLEAQQETPASETSSAPTTGPAERRLPSLGANPDTYLLCGALMEQITDYFKSTRCTLPELAATWPNSSTLQLTLAWPTPSTVTTTAGGHGAAAPDRIEQLADMLYNSPASSPEPAQGESDWAVLMSNMLYTLETDNAGHLRVNGLEYELMPSRTMKEGSERG